MSEKDLSIKVRLSCQVALLGAITPNMRLITIGWDEIKLLHLIAYFDKEPTDDEYEEIDAVSSEILSDIPFEQDKVECIIDNKPRNELRILKHVVYCRKE